jgi:hypothetical protein
MSKKSKKRVSIFLDKVEERNLRDLLERYGGKAPAYFHTLLKDAYNKEFGGYKSKIAKVIRDKPEENLTDEQFCELYGGKVKRNSDDVLVCVKGMWSVPIERRDLIKQRFK